MELTVHGFLFMPKTYFKCLTYFNDCRLEPSIEDSGRAQREFIITAISNHSSSYVQICVTNATKEDLMQLAMQIEKLSKAMAVQ